MDTMRTRFLNKMTGKEVKAYLNRSDIIFVPIGVVETHGRYPVDIETTIPEAASLLMARKTDGLVMGGLTYFFCGATTEARSTVQMGVSAGYDYIKSLVQSLIRQGFRRIILVGGHGPAYLSCKSVAMDVFKETGVPVTYMNCPMFMPGKRRKTGEKPGKNMMVLAADMMYRMNCISLGAYKVLDRLNEIVINPDLDPHNAIDGDYIIDDRIERFNYVIQCGPLSGQVGFYHDRPENHFGWYGELRSREELERAASEGEAQLEAVVDSMDLAAYVQAIRNIDLKTNIK